VLVSRWASSASWTKVIGTDYREGGNGEG